MYRTTYEATIIINRCSESHEVQLRIKRNINVMRYNFHFHILSYFYATVPEGRSNTYVCTLLIYRMSLLLGKNRHLSL